jgi:hypothetical protein
MMTLIKVRAVKPLGGYRLWFEFSDGSQGERDFANFLCKDRPVLEPLRDADYFARVFLQRGAPTWPNGFDLAPWALHDDMERDNALTRPPRVA